MVLTALLFTPCLSFRKIALLILTYLSISLLINYIGNGTALVTLPMIIMLRVITPTVDPFSFIVAGFMYYGPCVLFFLFYWQGILRIVAEWGYSYFIIIMLGVIMFIDTESRHSITFLPIFIIPLLKYMNSFIVNRLNVTKSLVVALCSLVVSRFWYPINVSGIATAFTNNLFTSFPAQRYYMSQGPWMSHQMYQVFGLITLIMGLFFFKYYFYQNNFKKIKHSV